MRLSAVLRARLFNINSSLSYDKVTPLCLATNFGNEEMVKLLLDYGAAVDIVGWGRLGWSAVHLAVKRGYADLLHLLIKRGMRGGEEDEISKGI